VYPLYILAKPDKRLPTAAAKPMITVFFQCGSAAVLAASYKRMVPSVAISNQSLPILDIPYGNIL